MLPHDFSVRQPEGRTPTASLRTGSEENWLGWNSGFTVLRLSVSPLKLAGMKPIVCGLTPSQSSPGEPMRTAIILNNLPPAGCVGNRDENASARRVRILYAEDNATVRLTAGWILARAGYSATTVEDGSEAWEALQSKRYDLLITDNEMPSLSGPELVSMARCHGMRLPVIVASGTLELSAAEGQQLRVAATLQKPFTADELLETIERVLFGASDAAGEKKDTRPDDCGTAEADLPHVREWDISE